MHIYFWIVIFLEQDPKYLDQTAFSLLFCYPGTKVLKIYKRGGSDRIFFFLFLVGSKVKWRRALGIYQLLIIFPEINL